MNKYLVKKDILLMEFLLNFYSKKNVKNLRSEEHTSELQSP